MTRRPDQNPRHEGEVVNYVHIRGPIISLEEINAALADPKREKKMTPKRFMRFAKNVFWPWGTINTLWEQNFLLKGENLVLHGEIAARTHDRDAALLENARLCKQIALFDRDGDGKPGGSKKKAKITK